MAYARENVVNKVTTLLPDINPDILETLLDLIEGYVSLYLDLTSDTLPSGIESLITEAVLSRFNKLGSEGYSKETIESVTVEYKDFIDQYTPLLQRFRRLKVI
jgi:hypothetical protein